MARSTVRMDKQNEHAHLEALAILPSLFSMVSGLKICHDSSGAEQLEFLW